MKFVIDTLDFEVSRSMIEMLLENELGHPVTVTECKEINEEPCNIAGFWASEYNGCWTDDEAFIDAHLRL